MSPWDDWQEVSLAYLIGTSFWLTSCGEPGHSSNSSVFGASKNAQFQCWEGTFKSLQVFGPKGMLHNLQLQDVVKLDAAKVIYILVDPYLMWHERKAMTHNTTWTGKRIKNSLPSSSFVSMLSLRCFVFFCHQGFKQKLPHVTNIRDNRYFRIDPRWSSHFFPGITVFCVAFV